MIKQAHILGQDASLLVDCQNGFKLLPDVCAAFKKMQEKAIRDGVDIQIVSSYRGFYRQLQIWQNKWSGKTRLLDLQEAPLDISKLTDLEKLKAILTWSALPGASRHHWGTDLDVFDASAVELAKHNFQLVTGEYETQGPCYALSCWLSENAKTFGFARPYQEYLGGIAAEPWHISYQPISEKITAKLNESAILNCLKQTDILGLETIESNMSEIFHRFILNKGTS